MEYMYGIFAEFEGRLKKDKNKYMKSIATNIYIYIFDEYIYIFIDYSFKNLETLYEKFTFISTNIYVSPTRETPTFFFFTEGGMGNSFL